MHTNIRKFERIRYSLSQENSVQGQEKKNGK